LQSAGDHKENGTATRGDETSSGNLNTDKALSYANQEDDAIGYLDKATKYLDRISTAATDTHADLDTHKLSSQFSQASTASKVNGSNGLADAAATLGDYAGARYVDKTDKTSSPYRTAAPGVQDKTPAKYKEQGYTNVSIKDLLRSDDNSITVTAPNADRSAPGYKEHVTPGYPERTPSGRCPERTASGYKSPRRVESEARERAPQGGRTDDIEEEELKTRVAYLEMENTELRERNDILSGQIAVIKVCACLPEKCCASSCRAPRLEARMRSCGMHTRLFFSLSSSECMCVQLCLELACEDLSLAHHHGIMGETREPSRKSRCTRKCTLAHTLKQGT
jgi:hypothetical protein